MRVQANASVYAVITSCKEAKVAPRSLAMLGSATLTMETSSSCMKTAIRVATKLSQGFTRAGRARHSAVAALVTCTP